MAKQDDDNYWTSSRTRGFDFDSEENSQDNFSELFGAHITTRPSSKPSGPHTPKTSENIPRSSSSYQTTPGAKIELSASLSSISSNSSTASSSFHSSQPSKQCLVTSKILLSTINVESLLSPADVVRSLFLGLSVDLSCLKKLSDKITLLDEAIKLGDGDVLTTVLLLLQKTLHPSVLYPILKERFSASQQYIDILEKQQRNREAAELCIELKRPRDAAIHFYASCLKENDQKLLADLELLHRYDMKRLPGTDLESDIVNEHIQLLQRQLPIFSDDSRSKRIDQDKFNSSPLIGPPVRLHSFVGSSLLATLQYCCRFHWNISENLLASPTSIKKLFSLTDKQFVWNAFVGLALAGGDPLPVLIVKSLFGSPKIAAGLPIPRVIEVASKLECSPNLIDQLLVLVDSSQERCQLAKRHQRHRIVADVLISNKDRLALLRFRETISDRIVLEYIENALKVSSTRWKN